MATILVYYFSYQHYASVSSRIIYRFFLMVASKLDVILKNKQEA